MNANELGFSGLSLRCYFINVLNGLKHFMTKLEHSLNPKTLKYISAIIYNLLAKYIFKSIIILTEIKFFMSNTKFW